MRYLLILSFTFTTLSSIGCSEWLARRRAAQAQRVQPTLQPRYAQESEAQKNERRRKQAEFNQKVKTLGVDLQEKAFILYQEYDFNEIAADQKYKDKKILVQGFIDSIGKDILGQAYVSLQTTNQTLSRVKCVFSQEQEASLASLKPGYPVWIVGRCVGQQILNVILEDCRVFESVK